MKKFKIEKVGHLNPDGTLSGFVLNGESSGYAGLDVSTGLIGGYSYDELKEMAINKSKEGRQDD